MKVSAAVLILFVSVAHARTCNILWDGRIPLDIVPADFDKNSSVYDHQFVHGDSKSSLPVYSEIILIFDRPDLGGNYQVS